MACSTLAAKGEKEREEIRQEPTRPGGVLGPEGIPEAFMMLKSGSVS